MHHENCLCFAIASEFEYDWRLLHVFRFESQVPWSSPIAVHVSVIRLSTPVNVRVRIFYSVWTSAMQCSCMFSRIFVVQHMAIAVLWTVAIIALANSIATYVSVRQRNNVECNNVEQLVLVIILYDVTECFLQLICYSILQLQYYEH